MDPEHPESHYNLGIAYSSLGMFEEAQREMAMAMKLRSRKQR
jgi:Flp pilus assembly protein TadD